MNLRVHLGMSDCMTTMTMMRTIVYLTTVLAERAVDSYISARFKIDFAKAVTSVT